MYGRRSPVGLHDCASRYGVTEEFERELFVSGLSLVGSFRTVSRRLTSGGGG